MRIKWQWFIGGRVMFWISILMMVGLVLGFLATYIINPTEEIYMKEQSIDPVSIKVISEQYVRCFGIKVDKPVVYRFVRYSTRVYDEDEEVLLGTFHEWNGTYYIDISVDLYKTSSLNSTVIHETRHMLVEYMRDKKIIDLSKYTEEIAQEKDERCNNLFNCGMYLLKQELDKENENG
jgi:hypothetical protein